jgi:hypothetical protein
VLLQAISQLLFRATPKKEKLKEGCVGGFHPKTGNDNVGASKIRSPVAASFGSSPGQHITLQDLAGLLNKIPPPLRARDAGDPSPWIHRFRPDTNKALPPPEPDFEISALACRL